MEIAYFGAGCFWGVERSFQQISGVKETAVGYMGGHISEPVYEQVCFGNTGHIEVCKVVFEESEVSYENMLDVFWSIHNPTTLNRQGLDVGYQYRSVIFASTEEQRQKAFQSKENLQNGSKFLQRLIVTDIVRSHLHKFWMAEDCHQSYILKRKNNALH